MENIEFLLVFWFWVALSLGFSLWLLRSRSTAAFVTTIVSTVMMAMCFAVLAFLVWGIRGSPVTGGFFHHDWWLLGLELLVPFWLSIAMSATAFGVSFFRRRAGRNAAS